MSFDNNFKHYPMKKEVILICYVLLASGLSAQTKQTYLVSAGTSIKNSIPLQERYRYPDFSDAKVFYKTGDYTDTKLNYNFLNREMEYRHSGDTLAIANVEDIRCIVIAKDTFFFNQGYLELLRSNHIKVALKQYLKVNEVQKKDSYGNSGSLGATDAYSSYQSGGITYKLVVNRDMVFEKILEYYLSVSNDKFVPFTRKQIIKLFPQKKETIQDYLKLNKTKFDSKEDLMKLTDYLSTF